MRRAPASPARWGLIIVVLVSGLGIIALLKTGLWRSLERLQDDFAAHRSEVFTLGLQLRGELERANRELLGALLSRRDADAAVSFQQRMTAARQLLAKTLPACGSAAEREAAHALQAALDQYQEEALLLLAQGLKAVRRDSAAQMAAQIEALSEPLMDAVQELMRRQRTAWRDFLQASEHTAGALQTMALASVLLQVLLLLAVAVLLRHVWVLPLQARLSDRETLLARQHKLASLGTLAAGVAHEIRNPLTAIKFRLFSFKKSLPRDLVDHDDLVVVGSELNRLERITRDFLQFARPAAPEWSPVPVRQLVAELQQLLGPQLERRGLQWVVEPLPALTVRMDRQQILQVLLNLVQNAADSSEPAGTIALSVRLRETRQHGRPRSAVVLAVKDNGRGIPAAAQPRLFDPFYSTKPNGTGLGLCIAESIVNQHGGEIEFQSTPGAGATFYVVLPGDLVYEH